MADDIQEQQGNLPVAVGKKQYGPDEADAILANMQKIIDERGGALNTFLSGLKDATAWTGGGIEGPTATLATRDRQKQAEIESLIKMQQDAAQIKAAQEAQRMFAQEQQSAFGGSFGGGAGAAGVGGAPGAAGAQQDGMTYKGVPIDMETAVAMRQAPDRASRDKIFNDYVSNLAKNRQQFKYSAPSYQKSVEVKVPDGKGGFKLEMVSPLEAEQMQRSGQGVVAPQQQQAPAAAPRTGVTPAAIRQVESGGREGLVSPKGAMGVMQVMPNTNRDPGYGVTPARDTSPAELKRVGEDYYGAMQKKYGNDTLAAIAYNMGPGKADTWLANGGDFNALPKETQNYIGKVHLAQAQLGRQPAAGGLTGAAASLAPISTATAAPTIPEMKSQLAISQAGGEAEQKELGKEAGVQATALESAKSNAGERLNSVNYVRNQMANTNVVGILSKPTVAAALGTLLKEGFDVGSSKTSIGGLDQAIAQAMKGSSEKDIAAMQNIGREFAKMELTESRNYLKGQGAVSDAERRLITRAVSNIGSSPESIKDFLKITEMRAKFDDKAGDAWQKYQEDHPDVSYRKFARSDEFKALKNQYLDELKGFTQSTLQPKQAAGAAPHPGASLVDKYLKK